MSLTVLRRVLKLPTTSNGTFTVLGCPRTFNATSYEQRMQLSLSSILPPSAAPSSSVQLSPNPNDFKDTRPSAANNNPSYPSLNSAKMSAMLEKEGFTGQQADTILQLIGEAVSDSFSSLTKQVTTKSELESRASSSSSSSTTSTPSFESLEEDLHRLENHDSSLLKTNLDRIQAEVDRCKDLIRDEVSRVAGSSKLDMNLEKGRAKEEIGALTSMVEQAEAKVETEVESLVKRMEAINKDMEKTVSPRKLFILSDRPISHFNTLRNGCCCIQCVCSL